MTVDEQNATFWSELCGTHLANALGIADLTRASLMEFDATYMHNYPYLTRYLDELPLEGNDVLEIGPGYGTVGQIIATRAGRYHAVDIAAEPVALMRDRLRWIGREGEIVQASALDLPWDDDAFDVVVSVGCLHHTGNLAKAVSEVHRVLRPGGLAFVMLYHADSYRRLTGYQGSYDDNTAGEAAPHTDFVSRHEAQELFSDFTAVSVEPQNFDGISSMVDGEPFFIPREALLDNVARVLGLDLYIHAKS